MPVAGDTATAMAGQISPEIAASIPIASAIGIPILIAGIVWRLVKRFSRG